MSSDVDDVYSLKVQYPGSCRRCGVRLLPGTLAYRFEGATKRYPVSGVVCVQCKKRGDRIRHALLNQDALRQIYLECPGCRDGEELDRYDYKHAGRFCINTDHRRAGIFDAIRPGT